MRKIISVFLAIVSMIKLLSVVSLADSDIWKTYVYDKFTVDYVITNSWENYHNISVTITNTDAEAIENWMLAYDFCGEINGIWNAFVETDDYGNEYIKNAGYNNVIEADETVNFGYTLNNSMYKPKIVHMG